MLKYPTKRFLTLTWVGWINFILFQWFFIRLGYGNNQWVFLTNKAPLTGWWSDYKKIKIPFI